MSKTIRRKNFNKKNRFFHHYWEFYSQKQVDEEKYISKWKYHSDNYYTKGRKDAKQLLKRVEFKKVRNDFKREILKYSIDKDIVLNLKNPRSISWQLH